jgi:hypothetical protein
VKSSALVRIVPPLAFALASAATSTEARADLPPPDGTRFVGYDFAVTGVASAKGDAFFAYPCSSSSGVPVLDLQVLEEGKSVSVGRRGGTCEVYRTSKARLDAFLAKREATPRDARDAQLEAFVKSAHKCSGAPALAFSLPTSDPRSGIHETYAVAVKGADCTLTPTTPPSPAPTPVVVPPVTASQPSSTPEPKGAVAPPVASSKGCSFAPGVGAGAPSPTLFGVGLTVGLALLVRRRRDDSGEK